MASSSYSRRFRWLAIGIVVVIAGYAVAWYAIANRIDSRVAAQLRRGSTRGITSECANHQVRGFPFRIGLFCDRVSYFDERRSIGFATGALRSAAQVYDPFLVVAELDGPARIEAPRFGSLALAWDSLRASSQVARPLPERLSVEMKTLAVTRSDGAPALKAQALEGHLRTRERDIDWAGSVTGMLLDPSLLRGRALPILAGEADLTLTNGVDLVTRGTGFSELLGESGVIRKLSLSAGTAAVTLSGPISLDRDGYLNGTVTVKLSDPQELARIAGDAFPEGREQITQVMSALAMLGPEPTLPLKIQKGRATLGFVRLGNIPPIEIARK